jgi:hypothetical protein
MPSTARPELREEDLKLTACESEQTIRVAELLKRFVVHARLDLLPKFMPVLELHYEKVIVPTVLVFEPRDA